MVNFWNSIQHFAQSMAAFIASGGQLVSQAEATRRAAICVSCHNNRPSAEILTAKGQCSGCNQAKLQLARLAQGTVRAAVIQNRSTPHYAKLESCAICGCDNKIQVWFPLAALGMNEHNINAYVTFCWKKQI